MSKQLPPEEVEEDFLEVDRPIPGQTFVCLSFISPEKVIQDKSKFMFSKFLESLTVENKLPENLDVNSDTVNNDLLPKYKNRLEELANTGYSYESVENAYKDFLYTNEKALGDQYDEKNDFRTSIRGLKVRGTYSNRREAEIRARVLQKRDPKFHVYVGQVGYWLPWDPNPDDIEDQEYNDAGPEANLNRLSKQYKQNLENVDVLYEEERENKRKKAIEENKKRRAEIKQREEEDAKQRAEEEAKQKQESGEGETESTESGDGLEAKTESTETKSEPLVSNIAVEPTSEDIQNIEKLRTIVNEKEQKYSGQHGFSVTHVDGEDVVKSSPLDSSSQPVTTSESLAESVMNSDDPWMKRKLEEQDKSESSEQTEQTESSEQTESKEV